MASVVKNPFELNIASRLGMGPPTAKETGRKQNPINQKRQSVNACEAVMPPRALISLLSFLSLSKAKSSSVAS